MPYAVDHQFLDLIKEIRSSSSENILAALKSKFAKIPQQWQQVMENYFAKYTFWGALNVAANQYEVLANRARALSEHWADFLWLYEKLADYRSRYALFAFVNNWYAFDFQTLSNAKERLYKDYFDPDIMKCDENEVLVDLGAFIGSTVINYINTYTAKYKRIYCYEITPQTFAALRHNLQGLNNIVFCPKGASDQNGVMYLSENAGDTSANILTAGGLLAVPTVTIDEDIQEPVTFIKMDIEGAEQKALRGCAMQIRNNKPKLALSVYHNNEDIWKIARLIEEICPGYDFYLRYHGENLIPTEMTLLAVYQS